MGAQRPTSLQLTTSNFNSSQLLYDSHHSVHRTAKDTTGLPGHSVVAGHSSQSGQAGETPQAEEAGLVRLLAQLAKALRGSRAADDDTSAPDKSSAAASQRSPLDSQVRDEIVSQTMNNTVPAGTNGPHQMKMYEAAAAVRRTGGILGKIAAEGVLDVLHRPSTSACRGVADGGYLSETSRQVRPREAAHNDWAISIATPTCNDAAKGHGGEKAGGEREVYSHQYWESPMSFARPSTAGTAPLREDPSRATGHPAYYERSSMASTDSAWSQSPGAMRTASSVAADSNDRWTHSRSFSKPNSESCLGRKATKGPRSSSSPALCDSPGDTPLTENFQSTRAAPLVVSRMRDATVAPYTRTSSAEASPYSETNSVSNFQVRSRSPESAHPSAVTPVYDPSCPDDTVASPVYLKEQLSDTSTSPRSGWCSPAYTPDDPRSRSRLSHPSTHYSHHEPSAISHTASSASPDESCAYERQSAYSSQSGVSGRQITAASRT